LLSLHIVTPLESRKRKQFETENGDKQVKEEEERQRKRRREEEERYFLLHYRHFIFKEGKEGYEVPK